MDLYGVKDSTMSYSKCAMPSLSCLLSFHTIPISLFFEFEDFFLFSSLPSFLCMHAYINSSRFIGGKGPRLLKKLSFCQIKGEVYIWTLHNYKLTHLFIA